MNDPHDMMLTEQEVCAWLSISRYTLYRARKDGTLRNYFQIGRRGSVRYSLTELREVFLKSDKEVWDLFQAKEKAKRNARREKAKRSQQVEV